MLFNDYAFLLVFLPASLVIYRFADPHPQWRIGVLVILSFVFYGYWSPPFIILLALSITVNFLAARAYLATKSAGFITGAIVANLAVLGFFKYANFVSENLTYLFERPFWHSNIALPLGISFFTFHHIMYLVDLRRGKAPEYSLGRYALYISFFPQAIAGPLARWSEVMHQPIITVDWLAASGEKWTVPIGGGFGRLFRVGDQPVSASIQAFYNVERPTGASDWTLRAFVSLLFPVK